MLPSGNLEQDEKKKKRTLSKKKTTKVLEHEGDFIYCHHEVHRSNLYVLDETTVSVPLNILKS